MEQFTTTDQKLGLSLDQSKNRITPEILSLLIKTLLASGFKKQREALFGGDKINFTEHRAVAHWALRDPSDQVMVAGKDVKPEIDRVKEKMETFSKRVRSGQWKGHTDKKITDVVNIGIGGSDLGPRMVVEALDFYRDKDSPRVHFVSNVDPSDITKVLKHLNPETTLFLVASKTFTTKETMNNASTL